MATILVVDDRPTNREFLVTLLGYAGHRLLEAADGTKALELVRAERPDLVIADLVMPIMDGYEFVRQLRADPAIAQTRVIFHSASYLQAEVYALAQACGVHHIITKPVEPEVVLKVVTEVLGHAAPPLPSLSPEEFHRKHLRVVTDKLSKQVEALEREVAERERAQEALEVEAQISAALARVGRELIVSLDTPAVLDRLCQLITEELVCDCSYAVLWKPEEEETCVPVAHYGYTPEQWEVLRAVKVPREAVADLLSRSEPEEVAQVMPAAHQNLLPAAALMEVGVTVGLWTALRRGKEIIGGLSAGYLGRAEPFASQQERLAQGIAQLASLALTNAQLFEELTRANRLKSDFLATMSHELRTPLNIVMGYTDLLLNEDFGPLMAEQNDALQEVKKAAHGELQLVIDLLDVSRLEAGRSPVELSEVHVAELIEEIKQETDRVREKPGLSWEWRLTPGLPQLHTDRMKLKIVLKNLLSNALKFTKQGSVTVEVHPQEGGVEFRVTDTGVGIAPEVQPVIFEMFRQGNSSSTRHYGGAGLGLYIVRRMLELLGGRVTVESEVGKGSTFRVWIPTGCG